MSAKRLGIGFIGTGNISSAYLKAILGKDGMPGFGVLDVKGLADMRPDAASARAAEFGLQSMSVEAMLADPAIDLVVNLTIPRAHVEVGLQCLAAGKHVYSEKPLGITFAEGRKLLDAAKAAGLRTGSAPDTFLGGSHQQARAVVDSGVLGQLVGGTAFMLSPGHESWHPDPAFYYDLGGGPMLDMGPYYITDLVNLLGPVAQVSAMSSRLRTERTITSEPKKGQTMKVSIDTHVTGALGFANGAIVQIGMSFDVAAHKHVPLELYGTEQSLIVPDPNFFGGTLEIRKRGREEQWTEVPVTAPYADGNYRSLGVADMASAILENRPHRANGDLALHVLEVMEAFEIAARDGRTVDIKTPVTRPAPLAESLKDGVLG
ncbi:Gfo/Idh/MocA family oxidoreductase [Devosia sp. XJ19-1]|uniref:Gfo/Idh/MocA family oxidoreductase n=1 Tax=Devosia ureilytica TaxID=2952754 RepID=A0A9Q4AMJ6_9HYPH|nr:Gfo/Idh/MocA family oxidoreductase [Devosia ureilytica]MCP8883271.1 Gfo/Idh/MocA family oxidoreductase [Devosia ureilytica]MCP8886361.1 Gfo/Idh/MocA family oxidoreductase [Devosia ureilytica]